MTTPSCLILACLSSFLGHTPRDLRSLFPSDPRVWSWLCTESPALCSLSDYSVWIVTRTDAWCKFMEFTMLHVSSLFIPPKPPSPANRMGANSFLICQHLTSETFLPRHCPHPVTEPHWQMFPESCSWSPASCLELLPPKLCPCIPQPVMRTKPWWVLTRQI